MKHFLSGKVASVCLLLLLSGCGTYKRNINPELANLQTRTFKHTGQKIDDWYTEDVVAQAQSIQEWNMEMAIRHALILSPALRASFEELGISKADLVQAGFIQNPGLALLFQFPPSCNPEIGNPYLDIRATMNISDFWQIPIKKKIARDDLEVQTSATLQLIIDITAETKLAYYNALYAQDQLAATSKVLQQLEQLKATTQQNDHQDYITDYDQFNTASTIGRWQIKKIEQEKLMYTTFLDLRNIIGIEVSGDQLPLVPTWDILMQKLPDTKTLCDYAQQHSPIFQISRFKIERARHHQELERAKIFDDVNFGIEWTRDNSNTMYIGPTISMDLPVFDQGQVKIERAKREEQKMKYVLENDLAAVCGDILRLHKIIETIQHKIHIFNTVIIPAAAQALSYTEHHGDVAQANFSFFLSNHAALLYEEYTRNEEHLALARALSDLEKKLGGSIPYSIATISSDK